MPSFMEIIAAAISPSLLSGRPITATSFIFLNPERKSISLVAKIICAVVVLATSWIGLALYYLWAKNHLTEWFK